jgi:hypothetical protein
MIIFMREKRRRNANVFRTESTAAQSAAPSTSFTLITPAAPACCSEDGSGGGGLRFSTMLYKKTPFFFECFPYVCPEPVLA